jgi:hypothetical protein
MRCFEQNELIPMVGSSPRSIEPPLHGDLPLGLLLSEAVDHLLHVSYRGERRTRGKSARQEGWVLDRRGYVTGDAVGEPGRELMGKHEVAGL